MKHNVHIRLIKILYMENDCARGCCSYVYIYMSYLVSVADHAHFLQCLYN